MDDQSQTGNSEDGALRLTIGRLDGSEVQVEVAASATLGDLRVAVEAQLDGLETLAYDLLMSDGSLLTQAAASLSELGVSDSSVLIMTVRRTRDYSRISGFEREIQCSSYPNGVLITERGELVSCHYSGLVQIYASDYTLSRERILPGRQACQMAFAPNGDLAVCFNSFVGVFDFGTLELKRRIGEDSGFRYARGMAIAGDRVFVSDHSANVIHVFSLEGDRLDTWRDSGDGRPFRAPAGLETIENRLLAVADRRNHKVQLIDLDGNHAADIGVGELNHPNDIAVDPDGNLLIMDIGNERIAVYREDGSFVTSVMKGWFKDRGNTYSYLAYNHLTGAIAVSDNDQHRVAVLSSLFE